MLSSLQSPLPPIIIAQSPQPKHLSIVPLHHRLKRLTSHVPKPPLCSTLEHALTHESKKGEAFNGRVEDQTLPLGLQPETLPRHVALIMDGNRRWARMRDLPVGSGYEAGVRSLRNIVELCCKWGIQVLSVFAFSSENWVRPKVSFPPLLPFFYHKNCFF